MFRMIGKIVGWIVMAGLIWALLRAFNWDLFGLFNWIWTWGTSLITSVADFLSGNATFQKIVETPA